MTFSCSIDQQPNVCPRSRPFQLYGKRVGYVDRAPYFVWEARPTHHWL
jgi:hypothetical protein